MVNKVGRAERPKHPGFFTQGMSLSFVAGIIGAAGALCIVFAVGAARAANVSPAAVASLVFCFAPIFDMLISTAIKPPAGARSPLLFVGILLAAAGDAMALYFKPAAKPQVPHAAPDVVAPSVAMPSRRPNIVTLAPVVEATYAK